MLVFSIWFNLSTSSNDVALTIASWGGGGGVGTGQKSKVKLCIIANGFSPKQFKQQSHTINSKNLFFELMTFQNDHLCLRKEANGLTICAVLSQNQALPAMHSVTPGLGLGAPSKFPIDLTIFQWKCPLQNENGLALFEDELPGLCLVVLSDDSASQQPFMWDPLTLIAA